ncbi:MAG: cobaltochelatase subunit CobN, partial [Synechococcales cyanobacterium]
LILANYPNRDGRIANGVGLDTPNSCTAIFKALEQAGYYLTDIPVDGDDLIRRLTLHVTNDPEGREWRPAFQYLEQTEFETYFQELPVEVQRAILERWQGLDSDQLVQPTNTNALFPWLHFPIPIPGLQLGNIFVGIQPSRGYDLDPSFNYHAPDLEPPPHYLAFYFWLRFHFNSQAIIHVGKHGN